MSSSNRKNVIVFLDYVCLWILNTRGLSLKAHEIARNNTKVVTSMNTYVGFDACPGWNAIFLDSLIPWIFGLRHLCQKIRLVCTQDQVDNITEYL